MRPFLRKIIQYVALLVVLNALVFYLARAFYFKSRTPGIKLNKFLNSSKKENFSIIILGSSHTMYGINSNLVSNSYNMASISQGLREDFFISKYLLQNDNHIKTLLVPLSYFSNHFSLDKIPINGEKARVFDYTRTYQIDYPLKSKLEVFPTLLANLAYTVFHPLNHGVDQFDSTGSTVTPCDSHLNKITDEASTFKRHSSDTNFNVINPYLDSIIDICAGKNIKLLLVVMPFTKQYNELIAKTGFNKWLETIKAKTAGKNCRFFDMRSFFSDSNEEVFFNNADHLSPCGRDKFSIKLNQLILDQTAN